MSFDCKIRIFLKIYKIWEQDVLSTSSCTQDAPYPGPADTPHVYYWFLNILLSIIFQQWTAPPPTTTALLCYPPRVPAKTPLYYRVPIHVPGLLWCSSIFWALWCSCSRGGGGQDNRSSRSNGMRENSIDHGYYKDSTTFKLHLKLYEVNLKHFYKLYICIWKCFFMEWNKTKLDSL